MSARSQMIASMLYAMLQQGPGGDAKCVQLDGTTGEGVLVIAPDGDHVQVLVQPIHFEPGTWVPF